MYPIALSSNQNLWATVDVSADQFTVACTYIENNQIMTLVDRLYIDLSGTTLLEAPSTGSRIIRQVILFCPDQDINVALWLGDSSPSVPILSVAARPNETITLGGTYDVIGRLNVEFG